MCYHRHQDSACIGHIISTSNLGAQCLISGHFQRSFEYLHEAFEATRALKMPPMKSAKCQNGCSQHSDRFSTMIDLWMKKPPQEFDAIHQFVYSHPIFIPAAGHSSPRDESCLYHDRVLLISIAVSGLSHRITRSRSELNTYRYPVLR